MLKYHLFLKFFHLNDLLNDHYMIIYVLMLIYHEYYRIQNNDLQLKLKDDYKYDESIVLYDEKILILLIYEQSKMKIFFFEIKN
jgi:hypothetical protein